MTTDQIAEYDDDTLASMWEKWEREGKRLTKLARGAFLELQERMRKRDATIFNTEHWSGQMSPGLLTHTIDDLERFRDRLAPHVSEDDLRAAFVQEPLPPVHADHRKINDLRKRGGLILGIIEEECRSTRGEDKLVLKRKPEKEDQC